MGTSNDNFCLQWNDFESNVSSVFRNLRQEDDFFDVTLGCKDGRSLQAHKVLLAACSSTFKTMLRDIQRNSNSHHPYIFLRGVSFPDLSAVLDFMYHGKVNVAQQDLKSFLDVAQDLQIKGLTPEEGGEPSKPRGSGPTKRPAQPSSENAPTVKNVPRSSPALPEQAQNKAIKIESDPEGGPSGDGQTMKRDGGASANYADESVDDKDYGNGENGDNNADGSMMEGDKGETNDNASDNGILEGREDGARGNIQNPDGITKRGKRFHCLSCNFNSEHKHVANTHYKLKHIPQVPATCHICKQVYKNTHARDCHLYKKHGKTKKF